MEVPPVDYQQKELDFLLNILIGGMLGNQEYTFFIKFRVCDNNGHYSGN